MEATEVKNTDISQVLGITNNSELPESAETSTEAGAEFSKFMQRALGGSGTSEVNEEELFAALIGERLSSVSEEAASFYEAQKAKFLQQTTRSDGVMFYEDSALSALKATLNSGLIDQETAERINGEAFAAAQLDSNTDALFDGRGSEGDQTIAVSSMTEAMSKMETMLQEIENGTLSVASRSLDGGATGTAAVSESGEVGTSTATGAQELDGDGGFLWKPESESDGNLVVLLPTDLRGLISKVELHSELPATEETLLEEGRFTGDEHNGERLHYRFNSPGGGYGENVQVVAYREDGETLTWSIGNGSERHD